MTMQTVSPATMSEPRVHSEEVSRAMKRPRLAPRTEAECDALLRRAERLLLVSGSGDIAIDLARFIGAAGAIWTSARRKRLQELLVSTGPSAVAAVLDEASRHPRSEVVDDAASVIRGVLRAAPYLAAPLAMRSTIEPSPIVRAVIAAGMDQSNEPTGHSCLLRLLDDPSPAVREAAGWALVRRGGERAQHAIQQRLTRERDALTREAFEDAIAELNG